MKKILLFALACTMLVTMFAIGASAANIGSAKDLVALMNDSSKWDGDYTLTADITVSGTPIGTYEKPFSGTFDGNGHTVTVDIIGSEVAGLFGVVQNATIKNVTIKGRVECTFAAETAETKMEDKYSATGGLVGTILDGVTVENCVNYAEIIGPCNLGGVAGIIHNFGVATTTFTGCANYGTVKASLGNMGGVLGRIYTQTDANPAVSVSDCANYADIHYESEDRSRLGGIVGYVRSNLGLILIDKCRNEGNITSLNSGAKTSNFPFVGGIAGRNEMNTNTTSAVQYTNCYNSGTLSSTKYAAGIAAYINRSDVCVDNATFVKDCVNVGAITGGTFAGGIIAYTESKSMADTRSEVINCLNTAPVVAEGSAGGIIGRQYGFDIRNSVNLGTVTADTNAGGLVGIAAGQIFCEIVNSFYPDTNAAATGAMTPFCMETSPKSYPAGAANAQGSFAGLDFSDGWTMGNLCPVPKAMNAEKIVIPTETAPKLEQPVIETTAPVTTVAPVTTAPAETTGAETTAVPETTAAPETTIAPETTEAPETTAAPETAAPETTAAPAPVEEGNSPVGIVIGIIAAVVVIVAIVLVVLKKKKA